MSSASPFAFISKICSEAALFDSKDRLLSFSPKGNFQSPFLMEAGDLFYEKWTQANGPLPLESFLPLSNGFTPQQKAETEKQFRSLLLNKAEDFASSDLYLLMGFLKWEGNALAPALLVPLDVNIAKMTVSLSSRPPIENIILRERLKDSIALPSAEEATVNGKFNILLYFSLFEKAIASEKSWKFTRHGVCLAFFNKAQLQLKKCLSKGFNEKEVNNSPILKAIFNEDGFQVKESIFDSLPYDQVFNPADHHFLFTNDSHTTKVTLDALDNDVQAYAIQALPGTAKMNVAANIVADTVAQGKRTLVVSRRGTTKQEFDNVMFPPFRSFEGPDRATIEPELRATRESFVQYFDSICKKFQPSNAPLSELLTEFVLTPAVKIKSADSIFKNVGNLSFDEYKELKTALEQITYLYFEQNGIETREAFKNIMVPHLEPEIQDAIAKELALAAQKANDLKPIIDLFQETGLFPTGIYLSGLVDTINLILTNFTSETPVYEQWVLRSTNWSDYQDTLMALPEAGDKWVRYRKQTSDIYTEEAVDENIISIREEFADSLNATLKGLSDHYRSSRKKLLKLMKDPKSIESDQQLLDLVDTLIDLQENKRAYKDSAVLGNHLLGKDWLFERSNWFDLNKKIVYLYQFRDRHQNEPQFELLLQILEKWDLFKGIFEKMQDYALWVNDLQQSIRSISKILALETPLESLSIEKWLGEIQSWNKNWANLGNHIQVTALIKTIEDCGCAELATYLKDAPNVNKNIVNAFGHYWSGTQVQAASKECPDLFGLQPKAKSQKGKAYRNLLDQLSNANYRDFHETIGKDKNIYASVSLDQTFDLVQNPYDLVVYLDAECISVVEALPSLAKTKKAIFIGDANMPALEYQTFDGYLEDTTSRSPYFQENILAYCLRRGLVSRELWFADGYSDASIIEFANNKIYNNDIKQFPSPHAGKIENQTVKIVSDKVMAVAKAAIIHAERKPGQTLGIVAFNPLHCNEIKAAIEGMVVQGSQAARFFEQGNLAIRYYVKTPDRAVGKLRDTILVCVETEGCEKPAFMHKVAACATLATQELQLFISEADMSKQSLSPKSILWYWIAYLQKKIRLDEIEAKPKESILFNQILEVLQSENVQCQPCYNNGGIPVGPVVNDLNNPDHFLALIEDDCTTERFRESVEDRVYIRHNALRQLGWKVINLWLPYWYMAYQDETRHMLTTIAIEQSVAPTPNEGIAVQSEVAVVPDEPLNIVPYEVLNPKIEGTPHDKPIKELPAASLITQLKFFVDHEAPIHEDLLPKRLLELHNDSEDDAEVMELISEAIKIGFKNQKFIQTGKFFYSVKNIPVIKRDRSFRPPFERKLAFVSPEERAQFPASMSEHEIKQALGLLE